MKSKPRQISHDEFMQTLKETDFADLLECYLEAKVGRYVTLIDDCSMHVNELADELDNELFAIIEILKATNP